MQDLNMPFPSYNRLYFHNTGNHVCVNFSWVSKLTKNSFIWPKKNNNMFLMHFILETNVKRWFFIFYFFE